MVLYYVDLLDILFFWFDRSMYFDSSVSEYFKFGESAIFYYYLYGDNYQRLH